MRRLRGMKKHLMDTVDGLPESAIDLSKEMKDFVAST
jgi:hypothetical protein